MDQSPVTGSPSLFAGSYVLHRLSMPRHPPSALSRFVASIRRRSDVALWPFDLRTTPQRPIDVTNDPSMSQRYHSYFGLGGPSSPPPGIGGRRTDSATRCIHPLVKDRPGFGQHGLFRGSQRAPKSVVGCPCGRPHPKPEWVEKCSEQFLSVKALRRSPLKFRYMGAFRGKAVARPPNTVQNPNQARNRRS